MTKEEAKKILQGAIKKPNTKDGYLGQAIDMAIKALEEEPCEDAVSREAVDKLCHEYLRRNTDENIAFYEHFVDLPSVTPQEPKVKVLDFDEVARKLGTVDVYKASEWATLLNDLEYLGLKICEVEE